MSRLTKIAALLFADRVLQSLEHEEHVLPNFALLGVVLVPEEIRRMISDHQRRVAIAVPAPAHSPIGSRSSSRPSTAVAPSATSTLGCDDLDLLREIGKAGCHFVRRGRAVARRAGRACRAGISKRSRCKRLPGETHRGDNFREQLSGAADERFASRSSSAPGASPINIRSASTVARRRKQSACASWRDAGRRTQTATRARSGARRAALSLARFPRRWTAVLESLGADAQRRAAGPRRAITFPLAVGRARRERSRGRS